MQTERDWIVKVLRSVTPKNEDMAARIEARDLTIEATASCPTGQRGRLTVRELSPVGQWKAIYGCRIKDEHMDTVRPSAFKDGEWIDLDFRFEVTGTASTVTIFTER